MATVATGVGSARKYPLGFGIVDCDVHPSPDDPWELRDYYPDQWRPQYRPMTRTFYDAPSQRPDAKPPGGKRIGADPDFAREQLLDAYGIDYAILLPRAFASMYPNADFASATARAFNDWLIDKWLDTNNPDGRFKGSITVAPQDPDGAAREIERLAGHPHMVQVMMDGGSRMPFGQRYFHPIYEAAERAGLPVALHPGTEGQGINNPPTPVGYPSYYSEFHALLPSTFQAHIASLLFEGVFEKYPGLKYVFVEGGATWLGPFLWRLDAHYRGLRAETPWLKRLPSDYVRTNIRLTSQPMEEAENDEQTRQALAMMHADEVLMFSSDYPHWDFDSPLRAFPKIEKALQRRIFSDTARELYGLPAGA